MRGERTKESAIIVFRPAVILNGGALDSSINRDSSVYSDQVLYNPRCRSTLEDCKFVVAMDLGFC